MQNSAISSTMMMMIGSMVSPGGSLDMGAQPRRRPRKRLVFAIRPV